MKLYTHCKENSNQIVLNLKELTVFISCIISLSALRNRSGRARLEVDIISCLLL
uniref:Uncharacterized protein n=1 Tax=Lotus japonicus TaxID=34305 RepID=I3S140_LOTJA|nr:unknown [Lotus japonicus]